MHFQLSEANEFVRKMNVVSTGGEDKKAEEKAEAEAAAEKRKKPANQGWVEFVRFLFESINATRFDFKMWIQINRT